MATQPVFLPGKYHGQNSLVDGSPQHHEESDVLRDSMHVH